MNRYLLSSTVFFLIVLLAISSIISGCAKAPEKELPLGYTFDSYTVAEETNISCRGHEECETPGEYLVRSNCPYTSLCLKGKCSVVCPEWITI